MITITLTLIASRMYNHQIRLNLNRINQNKKMNSHNCFPNNLQIKNKKMLRHRINKNKIQKTVNNNKNSNSNSNKNNNHSVLEIKQKIPKIMTKTKNNNNKITMKILITKNQKSLIIIAKTS